MSARSKFAIAVFAAALAALIFYRSTEHKSVIASSQEQRVLYWYDPMHPDQHFDKPGKSPFMDMQLVPRYAREEAADRQAAHSAAAEKITIDAAHSQALGVRLASVRRGTLTTSVAAVGNIVFNERDVSVLQVRSAGFVQRVYNLAAGDTVKRGAPLVDLLVPEWLGVQQEILLLQASGDAALLAAARARATALGMPPEIIAEIARSKTPRPVFTVVAPQTGIIKSLDVRAGMNLAAGAPLATINGIERVWLETAVPQIAAQSIVVGTNIEASVAALPKQTGKVIAILPESDIATRTLRVRVELQNPRSDLRPGLLAQVRFIDVAATPALLVPSAAVIRGGRGDRVIVADAEGHFHPVQVTLGREDQNDCEILQGLEEGQQVVAAGQFLIDSEANLTGQLKRLEEAPPARHSAEGQP
ncbi:MAG TPA: efflux RND transporter periplasmic adaptor subunit [Spongiibacteraceae bacterium]|nr:efflux RND transporter periplasmic adaptor subunit [Spongiibacteraceae bacterium]